MTMLGADAAKQSKLILIFTGLIMVAAGATRLGAAEPLDYKILYADRTAMLKELIEPVAVCVRRRDTKHAAFRGCVDWHSAVHGTWALVAYTRVTKDRRFVGLIANRLAAGNIAKERELLRRRPSFEMPYGRAWFLRLAIEHERTFRSEALSGMADDVARSLIARYKNAPPDPLSREYDNASWALIQLWHFGRHRGSVEISRFVEGVVRQYFLNPASPCPVQVERGAWPDFMSVCGNWAYLASLVLTRAQMRTWIARLLPHPGRIQPVTRPRRPHHYGMNFSRAWGYWRIYKSTGDLRFRRLFTRHFGSQYQRRRWWAGNYDAVGHWVPQFGIYALVPLFNE